jgi:hypothetical protein
MRVIGRRMRESPFGSARLALRKLSLLRNFRSSGWPDPRARRRAEQQVNSGARLLAAKLHVALNKRKLSAVRIRVRILFVSIALAVPSGPSEYPAQTCSARAVQCPRSRARTSEEPKDHYALRNTSSSRLNSSMRESNARLDQWLRRFCLRAREPNGIA